MNVFAADSLASMSNHVIPPLPVLTKTGIRGILRVGYRIRWGIRSTGGEPTGDIGTKDILQRFEFLFRKVCAAVQGQTDATFFQPSRLTLPIFNQLLCPLTLVPAENDGTEIMITADDLRVKVFRQGIPKPIDHRLETLRPRRFRSIPTKGDRGERDIHRKREIPRFLLLHPFAEHGGTERVVGFDIVHDSIVVVDDPDFVLKDKGPPCVEALGWGHAVAAFIFGDGLGEGFGLAGDEVVEFGACLVDEVVCGI